MSKRFRANFDVSIYDSEKEEYISASENGLKEIAKRMNEQQAEIERLKEQLSLVCKAESSAPYNSVKEVLRRQIFGLDCAAEESANAWNHYCVLNKLFQEQYGEYWDNEDYTIFLFFHSIK